MSFSINILPTYYNTIYFISICSLCAITSVWYSFSNKGKLCFGENGTALNHLALFLTIFLTLFLGLRPVDLVFVDTKLYADMYEIVSEYQNIDWDTVWLWNGIIVTCKKLGFTVNQYFLLIEIIYIGSVLIVCILTMRKNLWLSILFFLSSFSFYSYGVNGLRNGISCHLVLIGICLLLERRIVIKTIAILLFILATAIHNSVLLPCICIFSSFFLKSPKNAIAIWGVSIIFSLIFGNVIGNFIQSFGFFEEKMGYLTDLEETNISDSFSHTGFRFDFLLYSAVPVLFVWYLTVKRHFKDNLFNLIAKTYILANAFWILVIRASYTNRFAYLSWFIYPLLIAYPLIRMDIWNDQDRKTALILFAYSGFTFFMNFVYYA